MVKIFYSLVPEQIACDLYPKGHKPDYHFLGETLNIYLPW